MTLPVAVTRPGRPGPTNCVVSEIVRNGAVPLASTVSDPVVPHLGVLAEVGQEAGATVFVRAYAGDIEIWSDAFRAAQVARAAERQKGLMDTLREGAR